MKGGDLRHVVTIESPTEARAASGALTNAPWLEFAIVRAKIESLGGREGFQAGQFNASTTHLVTIRYLAEITSKMRVNFNERYFEILDINNTDERNREMVLQCKEGRSHGNT